MNKLKLIVSSSSRKHHCVVDITQTKMSVSFVAIPKVQSVHIYQLCKWQYVLSL